MRWLGLVILCLFYGFYFGKMLLQRSRGIRTDQMARGEKHGKAFYTELVMKLATYLAVAAEVFSILTAKPEISPVFTAVGAVIGLAGVALFATAVVTMRDSWRAGIAVSERTELVTGGIFQISRNPAFLAFDCVYLGLLLMFFNPLLLLCSLFAAVMLHLQILQEESYLADVFGDSYLAYKSRVRRYLGRKRPCSPCGGMRGTR